MDDNDIYKKLNQVKNNDDYIDMVNSNFSVELFRNKIELDPLEIQKYFNDEEYRPESKGTSKARNCLKDFYKSFYNEDIDIESIFITASTSESYNAIFSSILKDKKILLPTPTYPLINHVTNYSRNEIEFYELNQQNNWQINISEIEQKVTNLKVKAIVIITPNNPTGSTITFNELNELCILCKKNSLYLIIDTVFDAFEENKIKIISTIRNHGVRGFILNGLSKLIGRADIKLAWIIGINLNEKNIFELELFNDTFLNANYFAQFFLDKFLLSTNDFVTKINNILIMNNKFLINNSEVLGNNLSGIHRVIKVKNLFDNLDDYVLDLLDKHHVFVHPGYFYEIEDKNLIVISLLQSPNLFQSGLLKIYNY